MWKTRSVKIQLHCNKAKVQKVAWWNLWWWFKARALFSFSLDSSHCYKRVLELGAVRGGNRKLATFLADRRNSWVEEWNLLFHIFTLWCEFFTFDPVFYTTMADYLEHWVEGEKLTSEVFCNSDFSLLLLKWGLMWCCTNYMHVIKCTYYVIM